MKEDQIWLSSAEEESTLNDSNLPETLQRFYQAFANVEAGTYEADYIAGLGFGVDNLKLGPLNITIDNTRMSIVDTENYNNSDQANIRMIVLQGYAQISIFDRFYASCILIGKSSPQNLPGIVKLVDHLTKTDDERDELKQQEIDEVTMHPSFYASIYNDPINEAESTCGVYILADSEKKKITCDTVLQAIGIADFADNTAFGLAIGVYADINTFTNSMTFSIAASVRFANSERTTVAGELGLLNNKINSIAISIKSVIPIATEIYLTSAKIGIKGFQEPKIAISLGGGIALGEKIKVPEGLGLIKKAIFPNLKDFYPVELSVSCEINPARDYFSFSGQGLFLGNISVSASLKYDDGNWDAVFAAGTVRNNYINGSLTVDFHKRKDNWSLHGNFNCSVSLEWKSIAGITVSGGVDLLLTSQNYTQNNATFNRKDLKISVSGMGKVKLIFSISVSVQKTWIFNLSNQRISDPKLLLRSITSGETDLTDYPDVLVCESEDIAEKTNISITNSDDLIAGQSWHIDSQCSDSGVVKIQVAAQYTLVDTDWRLIHTDGEAVTVYTEENSAGVVSVEKFAHNYYELIVDTPQEGDWKLEIAGDKAGSGGIYIDALKDEKIITALEIAEQTDSAITFKYSAHTGSGDDHTLIQLFAEDLSGNTQNPFHGVIAYLEETENGEFIWEIPEEFRNNAQYRFYISAASSDAAISAESNSVEAHLERHSADLECSWELVYSATDPNTVTAYITISNSGKERALYEWELLDYTNNDSIDPEAIETGNTSPAATVIASGAGETISGHSTISFTQVITVTDELRDNPSSLQLTVTQYDPEESSSLKSANFDNEENCADAVDEIVFTTLNAMYSQAQVISWNAVEGASSYLLHYALEGDWENGGVFVNGITDTTYTFSATPGYYTYRTIGLDENGKMIGNWSEEEDIDILYSDTQTLDITADCKTSRSQEFSLNDGIYDLSGTGLENFSGTVILYRNDLSQNKKNNSVKITPKKVLTLTFVNGKLSKPLSDILLDHGDYFWEWKRSGKDISSNSEISIQLTGEVFSIEDKDREYFTIGGENSDVPLNEYGENAEILDGEVGFCNKDAIYQYMTNEGGELTLSIQSGITVDAKYKINIYVQADNSNKFTKVKSLTVKAGTYTQDTVILNDLAIKNNFYIQIVSWDNGKGKYNTDYTLDLSFDAFEDNAQKCDILEVDGEAVREWIGYRNEEHRYLLQIDSTDLYAVRLQGDAGDAVLKICTMQGKVVKKMQILSDGTAYIDNICLNSGNYFIVVEAKDKGKGKYNTDYTLSVSKMQTLYPVETLSIDGDTIGKWIGYQNPSHTYRLEIAADGRYAIRLNGDANEAILKICDLKGKVIKKMQINSSGCAYIDDIALEQGNYFVVVETKDNGKGKCNTDYTLSASNLQTLYPKIDNSNDNWKDVSATGGVEIAESIEDWLGVGDSSDFFKITLEQENPTSSYLAIELDEKTAQAVEEGILKFTCRDELGRQLALYELTPGQLCSKKAISGSEIYIGVELKKQAGSVDYSFDTTLVAKP